MIDIHAEIEKARKNLLDLTMRNRLLNFRPTKRRTLKIVDEISREIYDILVINERLMEFLPRPGNDKSDESKSYSPFSTPKLEDTDISDYDDSSLWKLPLSDEIAEDKHVDRYLQTNLESESLQRQLFYINQESNSILEEQGYTVLYLALGFLEWSESPGASDYRRAPLVLIPVELERQSIRTRFKLKWTGEEISTNASLQEILKKQSITIPDFEMPETKEGINDYFKSIDEAISSMPNWKIYDEAYLGFFSFTKFVMWKDLDINSWPENVSLENYPLIKSVFNPSGSFQDYGSAFREEDIDINFGALSTYHVMDADPSQIQVIENVKRGRNLVVEGPPGTGKSQTITNIISELLVEGKSVLFISEKMAALEVVKNRLDSVGLGEFCLELHSRKSKKREVLKEIERTINASPDTRNMNESEYVHLDKIKQELNELATSLREEVGETGLSVYKLYEMYEVARGHYEKSNIPLPSIQLLNAEAVTEYKRKEVLSSLRELKDIQSLIRPVSSNPWLGCSPENIVFSDEKQIIQVIQNCITSFNNLNKSILEVSQQYGTFVPKCIREINSLINAATLVANSKPVDQQVLVNSEWNEPSEKATGIINTLISYQTDLEKILKIFKNEALEQDSVSILGEYEQNSKKFFRFLPFSSYRSIKKEIKSWYLSNLPKEKESIMANLKDLIEINNIRDELRTLNETASFLFGSFWKGEISNTQYLKDFSEWITSYRKEILKGSITERSADIINKGVNKEEIEAHIKNIKEQLQKSREIIDSLKKKINPNFETIFGSRIDDVNFSSIIERLENWGVSLDKLHLWTQYIRLRKKIQETIASPLIEQIENDRIEPENLEQCFLGNFANNALDFAFRNRPSLANFIGELHERKIREFSELDRELINKNRIRVRNILHKIRPQIYSGASKGSEAGVLLGELNRKRGHMPIRKLLMACGNLIKKIKPCYMMSPMSIAQFLDPSTIGFDAVIFDEASQVKPEDALGSLFRGRQLVVMGDTEQLPPTTFFDLMIETEYKEYEEVAQLIDMESILHKCKTSFPTNTLKWHYRSKHESLIAVSNQEFYDNQLLIYPSPVNDPNLLGLKHEYLPDAIYDRGRSSVNRLEAKEVAKACVDHYRKFPSKSLGVGTFNIKQQQAILEEIELQLRENPEIEEYFNSRRNEHFFVKNLETIQGDERDVIFLSVGFGKDINGNLSLNFGPLNQEGGYRRLNVLITRARERCIVFSNFRAEDLQLDENSVRGLRALKIFLEFAHNRKLISLQSIGEDTDSPFEDSVYEFLKSNGYSVHKQIGCAGFRVDLGIVDTNTPGNYLVGIECDGAKYHSSPVARDRDRMRQQILESKGWRIYRVWSTDWYRNRKQSGQKLIEAVNKAKEENNFEYSNSLGETDNKGKENAASVLTSRVENVGEKLGLNVNESGGNTLSNDLLNGEIDEYRICNDLGINAVGEIHQQPIDIISDVVVRIVEVEAPIHFDEVVRRIRTLWGLERAGRRINQAVKNAANFAENEGKIIQRRNFLWCSLAQEVRVRKRSEGIPANIELICNEEIIEAIKLVLKHQHATENHELAIQASRLLGFQVTRNETRSKIESIIDYLLYTGHLVKRPNGMIDLNS